MQARKAAEMRRRRSEGDLRRANPPEAGLRIPCWGRAAGARFSGDARATRDVPPRAVDVGAPSWARRG